MEIQKPFLKWVGGKTQIITKLLNNYPKEMNNYHDVFLGGGSTLLALLSYAKCDKINIKNNIYAYDVNEILINVYINIQKNPNQLYKKLKDLSDEYLKCTGIEINRKPKNKSEGLTSRESYYYWTRSLFNKLNAMEKKNIEGSAIFMFLNKTCFRGVYRVGPNGFNVPFGHYLGLTIICENELNEISELIKNVEFKCMDFSVSVLCIKKGDFAYLDPPYAPEKSTSFVKYNIDGFDMEKHKSLFELCNKMRINHISFMMSNSNVKLVNDSFSKNDYSVEILDCKRSINSKNPGKKTKEVIIKTY